MLPGRLSVRVKFALGAHLLELARRTRMILVRKMRRKAKVMRRHKVIGGLTDEPEGVGGIGSAGYGEAGGKLYAPWRLSGDIGERRTG